MQLRYLVILCGLVIAFAAAAVPYSPSPTPSPQSAPEFDFAISVSPSEIECLERDICSVMVTVAAQSINQSTHPVSLTISGLPESAVYSFEPETGVPPFTSKLFIETKNQPVANLGKHELTISGSGGGMAHSTTLTLMILLRTDEDSSLGC